MLRFLIMYKSTWEQNMNYDVTLFSNEQISKMDDNQLHLEIRTMKQVIYKSRKARRKSRVAEEEVSYLQAEAQNRGHKA